MTQRKRQTYGSDGTPVQKLVSSSGVGAALREGPHLGLGGLQLPGEGPISRSQLRKGPKAKSDAPGLRDSRLSPFLTTLCSGWPRSISGLDPHTNVGCYITPALALLLHTAKAYHMSHPSKNRTTIRWCGQANPLLLAP